MELMPFARLQFSPAGIEVIDSSSVQRITPQLASILEVFAHRHRPEDAYTAYFNRRDDGAGEIVAEITNSFYDAHRDGVLLLIGSIIALSPKGSQALAYQLATSALARGVPPDIDRQRLLHGTGIIDLTAVSRPSRTATKAIAARHKLWNGQAEDLSDDEFAELTRFASTRGLLTVNVGAVTLGDLRRYAPLCPHYGFTRGMPIDRIYLEQFVSAIRGQVRGTTLEIGGQRENQRRYKLDFATSYVTLDLEEKSGIDIVGDIHDRHICRPDSFDSILAFNVLEHCERPWIAVENMYHWLKPNGKVFCIVPNMQRVHRDPKDYWRILPDCLPSLFASYRILDMGTFGNLLTSIAALSGLAADELCAEELSFLNPQYPVVTWVIAEKTSA